MKRAIIEFQIDVPDDATVDQVVDWMEFHGGLNWTLYKSPMSEVDMDIREGTIWARVISDQPQTKPEGITQD